MAEIILGELPDKLKNLTPEQRRAVLEHVAKVKGEVQSGKEIAADLGGKGNNEVPKEVVGTSDLSALNRAVGVSVNSEQSPKRLGEPTGQTVDDLFFETEEADLAKGGQSGPAQRAVEKLEEMLARLQGKK